MAKRASKNLPHLNADTDRLVADMENESDRGAALLAAAFLDDVLDLLLRSALVDDAETVDRLLGPGRALESFGARTHLAYLLGLLGPDIYADINLIREIRNEFAHRKPMDFDVPEISGKCELLRCVSSIIGGEKCTPRERFVATVVLLCNHLMVCSTRILHATPAIAFANGGVLRAR